VIGPSRAWRPYEAARVLEREAGLSFVVGPLRSLGGSVIVRLADRFSVAVFPFVHGASGQWGDPLDRPSRDALIRTLASLHGAVLAPDLHLTWRPFAASPRPALTAAFDDLRRRWEGGPFSEPARHALAGHAGSVERWLERLDALADRLQATDDKAVVTHGEPHPGNLMRSGASRTSRPSRLCSGAPIETPRGFARSWLHSSALSEENRRPPTLLARRLPCRR
jgi:spectinomycin phosphotransferase